MAKELVELEISEDDILYYIDDEQGREIGFAIMENGKEVEYYYPEEEINEEVAEAVDTVLDAAHHVAEKNPYLTRDDMTSLQNDMNSIYKQNADTIKDMKGMFDDMKEFTSFFKKPL